MADVTQANRQIAVETPLGTDVLILTSFQGSEVISRLFQYNLEMYSTQEFIAPHDIVGKNVSFRVDKADGKPRWFNGFVSRFSRGRRHGPYIRYAAEVVPWLWFLTRRSDSRIFQNKKIPQILEEVFRDAGNESTEHAGLFDLKRLTDRYVPWEYCVQYRETDFNFVSRLMEQEGIFYYFKHGYRKHVMVLGDHVGVYENCDEKLVEHRLTFGAQHDFDGVTEWHHDFSYVSGKCSHTDYNFIRHPSREAKSPSNLLFTEESVKPASSGPNSQPEAANLVSIDNYEMFDFPGEYKSKSGGQEYARIRIEEEDAGFSVAQGMSTCKSFCVGGKFKFSKHECGGRDDDRLCYPYHQPLGE